MDYPIICLAIFLEIIYSFLLCGFLSNNSSAGGSVAKAKDARVSIIKFTQSIYIGVKTSYLIIAALIKVRETATTFTVN